MCKSCIAEWTKLAKLCSFGISVETRRQDWLH
ncbi:hypothetical protein Bcoa_0475 [Heyndrickxia coagulans 36D1]|uniref:Uncharacterized protein n=1 Tax=Heyndrickxia coagulans 36D1 TaxID=345219 RepID=G2TQ50_HEYCO|nr:hypothetical protein Bcoa_0475 [Heyndrickxia coagulans 36D1]